MKGKHSQSHEAYLTDKNYCRVHVIHDVCLMSEKVWRLVFIFQPCPSSADITHPLPSTPLEQVSLLGELLKMPSYQEDKSSLKQLEAAKYPPDLLSYRMIQCLIVCIKSHCVVLMQKVVRPLYIEWWCSEARCLHRAKIILNGNTHRNHCRFNLLLPDIRYRSNCCCTARPCFGTASASWTLKDRHWKWSGVLQNHPVLSFYTYRYIMLSTVMGVGTQSLWQNWENW